MAGRKSTLGGFGVRDSKSAAPGPQFGMAVRQDGHPVPELDLPRPHGPSSIVYGPCFTPLRSSAPLLSWFVFLGSGLSVP